MFLSEHYFYEITYFLQVLQLIAVNESTLITSSLDQSLSVWNVSDGKLEFNMK